ncbi:tripartite tricarboxylate transporter substrate binding protein [Cupriavidus sp. P-10]|uniref:Bug family tripartite tricarboxylate transporter substrate binding protein n=1 Tax=Cupriavidus sp. P-10 TaxID=2027911 RepID=UPI000E2EEF4C|nr:tripartite tricarboxylate transporter substrate binding protein [Cupriavidus sp. P-10]BDB24759.1 tripartite tricarboxylate transporter substrate binding protein [Cupriavidus sp. P-10]
MNAFKSWLAVALASVSVIGSAGATNGYPSKPVSIIVPFAPGGGSDNVSRYIATRLSDRTKAQFVIDNRPGAGTNIGNEVAARSTPDGQTLLFGQVALSINPFVYKKLRYDTEKDFVPVVQIATSPTVLVVTREFPEKDLKGVIRHIKANPGKVNFASGGKGTSVHLAGELFRSMIHADMVHVPYKGSGPAVTDLIGGQVQMMFDTAASALPQLKGGKLRAIAVTGTHRLPELPDVPTFAEAGLPGFDAPAWYGLLAPAGTPKQAVQFLNAQINEILKEPGTRQRLAQLGAEPSGGTPEDFARFMRGESARWSTVVKTANVSAD